MSSTASQQQQQSRYPLRNRLFMPVTATAVSATATTSNAEVIDLTRLTPSPQPSTSTGIRHDAAAAASVSFIPVAPFAVVSSQSIDLYTQLQNLEGQNGVIRNTEPMFCSMCDLFLGSGEGVLVRNCLHQICTTCIKIAIIGSNTIDVKCPILDCHYSLQDREIESLLTQSEFECHMNKPAIVGSNDLYKDLLELEEQGLVHNTEPFECKICFTDIDVCRGILIRECLHQYCMDCIRHTINLSEEARIKCPTVECACYIHDREIHALLTQEEFDKYTAKTLRIAESQETNSYHCKKANCQGWCIVEDEINTFICPVCSSQNCLACRAIHAGQNCQQYQDELRYAGMSDDQRSEMCLDEMVKKNLGMRCTTCKIVIMKREGCDYLKCSMCKTDLCWATKMARWGPGGHGDTSGGCGCLPTKKCHPNCRNCH